MTVSVLDQVVRTACLLVSVLIAGYAGLRSTTSTGDSADQRRALAAYATLVTFNQLTLLGTPATIRTAATVAATVVVAVSFIRVELRSRRRRPK